jgi:nucleoside-diphosphate-sugar epimerase
MHNNILVTGATGFIGSHLVKTLIETNAFNVSGVSRKKISDGICNFHYVEEIGLNTTWGEILLNQDVVIHTAGIAHRKFLSHDDALFHFREVNVKGTLNLAKQALIDGVKRFIFISSINVHGFSRQDILTVNSSLVNSDPSSITKIETEIGLENLTKNSDMELVILRIPLVYGDGVPGNFKRLINIIGKLPLLPFGSLKNIRSFIGIDNLIDIIINCINHPNAGNQTFLVSDDHDFSITEMVKLITKLQGVKPWLVPVPIWMFQFLGKITGKSDMISRLTDSLQADITHTKESLDWTPPYSVDEGFAICVQKPIENDEIIEK